MNIPHYREDLWCFLLRYFEIRIHLGFPTGIEGSRSVCRSSQLLPYAKNAIEQPEMQVRERIKIHGSPIESPLVTLLLSPARSIIAGPWLIMLSGYYTLPTVLLKKTARNSRAWTSSSAFSIASEMIAPEDLRPQ